MCAVMRLPKRPPRPQPEPIPGQPSMRDDLATVLGGDYAHADKVIAWFKLSRQVGPVKAARELVLQEEMDRLRPLVGSTPATER